MAGDWIKIEHTTPDKPEVICMAQRLKIDPDSVVGKLIRVWVWADQNSVDGNGVTVTDAFLDRLAHRKGFAKAMRGCGWLDGKDGGLIFPGFFRHNGNTAKARAAGNRRVSKHRDCNGNVTSEALQKPLPEKRREEKSKEDADASSAAAAAGDDFDNEAQAVTLCQTHPSKALTRPALLAALDAIKRHSFEAVLAGTLAYANAVSRWTSAERMNFVKNPEAFFRDDLWNQAATNFRSRVKARQEIGVVDMEAAKQSLGRRAAHIS